MPLVALDHVSIAFGHLPLLDDVSMQIDARERVAIIGRNGTGKSTLLQIISGEVPPDAGSVWRQPALKNREMPSVTSRRRRAEKLMASDVHANDSAIRARGESGDR